jgi:hypothetical protein
MKMEATFSLHDVYCDVTYPEYLHVRNQFYKNPTSFKCFKIIVCWDLFITFLKMQYNNGIPKTDLGTILSQQNLSLNTIFSYGKIYRDWT